MKLNHTKLNLCHYMVPLLIGLVCSFSSCKKWLDVSPKTEIKEAEQFSTEQGFIDALFGVYQKASDPGLYGAELTFGILDVFAQRYEGKTAESEIYGQTARYRYDDGATRAKLNTIWAKSYETIAQCNYILANVDKQRSVLSDQSYGVVKGEAFGMRGFLHFDLLRMYAPAYLSGANAAALSIPYMDAFQVKPQERLTLKAAVEKCEADLLAAEQLLAVYPEIDPIPQNQGSTNDNLFLMYRQNHMNYWAVKATLARLFLYKGDKPQALKYAKQVMESGKFFFIEPTVLNNNPEQTTSDMTFSREHIFSVYTKSLKANSDIYFKTQQANLGDAGDYYSTEPKLDEIYEFGQVGYGSDIRGNRSVLSPIWSRLSALTVYNTKYYVANVAVYARQSRIPVIRLSEMYYIAAEADPDRLTGLDYLNKVRQARLLPKLPATITSEQFDNEIFKEYRKEFYAEGQLWFYYKRKNQVVIPHAPAGIQMNEARYVFPLPEVELEFGK